MGKKLYICEKPSVAREVASAVGARKAGQVWEGPGAVVLALHGHVCDLAAPDAYEGRGWDRWALSTLPIAPSPIELTATDAKLVRLAREQVGRADVDEVVHACDPDREGEGIARRLLAFIDCGKPVSRLWANSLEPEALARAVAEERPDSDYDGLGDAAWGRACADWLVGMNMTRACSVHCDWHKPVLHVGRVVTPTLRLVCDRTRAHDGHKAQDFFVPRAMCEGVWLEGARVGTEAEARAAVTAMEGSPVEVERAERRERRVAPPALYDLTSAQRDASRAFGIPAKRALDALQSLYEAKLTTYPRTDSRYITSDDRAEAEALLASEGVAQVAGTVPSPCPDASALVDDARVSGHTALLPTRRMSPGAISGLPEDERRMALLVCCRLFCAAGEAGVDMTGKVEASCGGVALSCSLTETIEEGWRATRRAALGDEKSGEDEQRGHLPEAFAPGARLAHTETGVRCGKTKPPALYTDATLLSAMEHADRLVEDKEAARALRDADSHAGGIGTPATRAQTIEKLVGWGYAERRGKAIAATELGFAADASVPDAVATPELTGRWERELAEIEAGRSKVSAFVSGVEAELPRLIAEAVERPVKRPGGGAALGTCPRCGKGTVVKARSGKVCYCDSRRGHRDAESGEWVVDEEGCGYKLGCTAFGKRLTDKQLQALVAGKRVALRGAKTSKGAEVAALVGDASAEWGTRAEFKDAHGPRGKRRVK